MSPPKPRVAMLGAGAIGLWVGADWGAALIGRAERLAPLRADGLRLSGDGVERHLPADALTFAGPEALGDCDLIALAVKATSLEGAIAEIHAQAQPETPILCLLNGLAPVRDLKAAFPAREVLAGMVPFNVVWRGPAHLHRSSAGVVAVEDTAVTQGLAGRETILRSDMVPLQYGKLLLNLINPINALSGLGLREMLSHRAWRRIYAAVLDEAMGVYDAANVPWIRAGPIPPRLAVRLLALPDAVFTRTLLPLQKIDPNSITSMAADLETGRPTEIDILNGEIVALADAPDRAAPRNATLVRLIHAAEAGGRRVWTAKDLGRELGL
ncbi:MAG: 2-dehydropantoate 2-reductase [Pseudomonadota bacterium]